MEAKLCQSCGMPLSSAEVLGTNADGSLNEEYCTYCYQHGQFCTRLHYGRNDRTLCTVHRQIQQGFRNEFH